MPIGLCPGPVIPGRALKKEGISHMQGREEATLAVRVRSGTQVSESQKTGFLIKTISPVPLEEVTINGGCGEE